MNKIRIALENAINGGNNTTQAKRGRPPKPESEKKPKKEYKEKLYTIEDIKRELYGFQLMTDPSEIAEGAMIKYIRIDGEDAYKFRGGGFLVMNLETVFHLKSMYGVRWQIFTDPEKNIIFYYYPASTKALLTNGIPHRTKEQIEESGDGVLSKITPGSVSAIMANSQIGGTIPISKKNELIREIYEKSKFNETYKGLHTLAPEKKKLDNALKPIKKLIEKNVAAQATIVLAPKNKKVETKKKQSARYSYESSYSLPSYSYSYTDSDDIKRPKALSIPRRGAGRSTKPL